MTANPLKALRGAGKPVLNGWLSIASPFAAEIVAAQGYDSVTIDMQHGMIDDGQALAMLQALRGTGVIPLARAPWNRPEPIMKALDMGALGIICPMVNSPEEAAAFVACLRYPPRGARSFGPTRAAFSGGADYVRRADEMVTGLAMIETAEGLAAVEAIARTPGLDGLYIGPSDLTLGVAQGRLAPGFDREEPEMLAAIHSILKAAKGAGVLAALHCGSPEYAAKALGWGFDMVTLPNDVRLLASGAAESVARTRRLLG